MNKRIKESLHGIKQAFFFPPPSLHPKLVSLGLFFTGQRIELLKLQGIDMPFIASATQLSAGLLEIKGQHFGGCKIIASTPDESASLIYVSWFEKVSTSSNWFPTSTSIYIISIVLTYMKHLEENVFSSHFCFLIDNKDGERQFGRNVS
jgi:hypothetical protein